MKVKDFGGILPSSPMFKEKKEVFVVQRNYNHMDEVMRFTTCRPDDFENEKYVFKIKPSDTPLNERMLNRILAACIPLIILTSCNHTMLVQQRSIVVRQGNGLSFKPIAEQSVPLKVSDTVYQIIRTRVK